MQQEQIETCLLFDRLSEFITRYGGSFTTVDRDDESGKQMYEASKHFQLEVFAKESIIKLTYSDESEIRIVKTNDEIVATKFDAEIMDTENIDPVAAIEEILNELPKES